MEYSQDLLIKKLSPYLHLFNLLKDIISPQEKIYLVGGSIRDLLLSRKVMDFDLVTFNNPLPLVKQLSQLLKGSFFKIKENSYCLVYKEGHLTKKIDFSKVKESSFLENLRARDFTVNAMGIEISNLMLIDPFEGRKDLKQKNLKVVNPSSFLDDPLRLLRAIRLKAQLRFKLDPQTEEFLIKSAPRIKEVASERIINELSLILEKKDAYSSIKELKELNLLVQIIPELAFFKNDLFNSQDIETHLLNSLKELEEILGNLAWYFPDYQKNIKSFLRKKYSCGRSNLVLLKLAVLLHDIGKPLARSFDQAGKICFFGHQGIGQTLSYAISKRLALSNQETEDLGQIIKHHMQIGYLSNSKELSHKALWRFYKRVNHNLINTVLLSLADKKETHSQRYKVNFETHLKLASLLIHKYLTKDKVFNPPSLVTGDDLIQSFNLTPGPVFKVLLNEVKKTYLEGTIKNKREALEYLERYLFQTKL
ncbi:HD domain-containing protein [bacterium]|nr:HD domain-containing protein [bacterium]MBU1153753.1 HD domain-containing protein [bacterium]MBU1782696.1 HD domain-containing protein [bacterium]